MSDNPYQTPQGESNENRSNDLPGLIRYRVFRVSAFSIVWSGRRWMERLRAEAQAFIDSDVGVDNVVSIAEHSGLEYSIAVWYRTKTSEVTESR